MASLSDYSDSRKAVKAPVELKQLKILVIKHKHTST